METVNLTFRYTQEEYVKSERQYLFASKIITKTSIVVLAIYLPFSLLYFILSSFSVLSTIALGIAIVVSVMGCVLYFYMPAYKFKKTSKYHEEYNVAFSNDGIKFKTPTINSELKWEIYSELWESDEFYFLVQALRIYTLIPKRVFQDSSTKQAFEEMAIANLKCGKRTF